MDAILKDNFSNQNEETKYSNTTLNNNKNNSIDNNTMIKEDTKNPKYEEAKWLTCC